ncbi:uncharacterized protein LOC115973109 [Quercus lobata]|uniref:uncharacterized protein LOC115973109 n=1 Tax=Quercus lobata TaxID=97700 RepID=UPI001243E7A3|nr:uncharacterized protein LOC115973109 [Quercus lobata]
MNLGSGSKTFKKGKEGPTCSHCGLLGHTVEKCYKIHGYPPGYKTKARANPVSSLDFVQEFVATPTPQQFPFTMEQCQKLLAMIGGSDSHNSSIAMANSVSSNQASTSQSTILAGNLKHSIFSAKLVNRFVFGGSTWVLDIGASDHIACSLSLFHSYIAVSHCVVELPNGESAHVTHIGIVKLSNSLTLEHVLCVPSFSFNLVSDLSCWRTIGVGEVQHGLYLLQNNTSRTPPFLSDYLSTNMLPKSAFLASVYVWGPYYVCTYDGFRFFLTIVDDATRSTWAIRSNNAPEFSLSNFYSDHDIVHQKSCIYTPQQNSVVKRKHQHLLNVARSLQFQSNLPSAYWENSAIPPNQSNVHPNQSNVFLDHSSPSVHTTPPAAPPASIPPLRKSTRISHRPAYLQAYKCNQVS